MRSVTLNSSASACPPPRQSGPRNRRLQEWCRADARSTFSSTNRSCSFFWPRNPRGRKRSPGRRFRTDNGPIKPRAFKDRLVAAAGKRPTLADGFAGRHSGDVGGNRAGRLRHLHASGHPELIGELGRRGRSLSVPTLCVKTSTSPRRFTRWPGRSSGPVDLDTANARTASTASKPTKRPPDAICCASRITRRAIAGGCARRASTGSSTPAAVREIICAAATAAARVEILRIFAGDGRLAIEDIDDPARKARLEKRQQFVADAIARNRRSRCSLRLRETESVEPRETRARRRGPPR